MILINMNSSVFIYNCGNRENIITKIKTKLIGYYFIVFNFASFSISISYNSFTFYCILTYCRKTYNIIPIDHRNWQTFNSAGMVEFLKRRTSNIKESLAAWIRTQSGASRYFLQQETLHSLLNIGWFQEWIREFCVHDYSFLHNRTKINPV